jgi:hypothetical protein
MKKSQFNIGFAAKSAQNIGFLFPEGSSFERRHCLDVSTIGDYDESQPVTHSVSSLDG